MNRAKLRILLRWGVSILLALACIYFLIAAFSTAVLGAGAERGQIREAWNQQAAFQFAMATLTWMASVIIFVSLRPGGLIRAVRGQKITRFKRWLYVASLIISLGAFILSNPRVLITKLEIHRCMKVGASWNFLAKRCEFRKSAY